MNAAIEKKEPGDIPITGRFDQYRSSFWAAALAGISIRYFPRPLLRGSWEKPSTLQRHAYSSIAGLFMEGVTGYYASQTWKDMKSIFSQSLAWELDKNPEDLTYADFKKSKNTIIKQTVDNYSKYNMRRALVQSVFFLPLLISPFVKNMPKMQWTQHPETGVDLGVAANAAYLLHDVVDRRITPFEELQALIDKKINQSDHFADKITVNDLFDIYERHAAEGPVHSFLYQRGTDKWQQSMQVFERMADLINQTHKNVVPHEEASFGFPKFIYLMGNGYIDPYKIEQSLMMVEIANKYDVGAVKRASYELKHGATIEEVMNEFHISPKNIADVQENAGDRQAEIPSPLMVSAPEISASAQNNFKQLKDKDKSGMLFQDKVHANPSDHVSLSA